MAEIKMSYIFIEKQKHELETVKDILLGIIDGVVQDKDNESIIINNIEIKYRIIQKKHSTRCFLELVSTERVNKSIPVLQIIDNALLTSNKQRYYYSIRDYDGISENFCKKLYPKYAEFERKIRSLVLFVLTKAYGSNWKVETLSDKQLRAIQETAHGKVSLNDTLENMDLALLEEYLFGCREVDYLKIINEKLSTNNLKTLNKEEICTIIEQMRPTSLWERHFEKYGSQETWKERILNIHNTRNKVAHQKTISIAEFAAISKELNQINRDLDNAIEGIREENFTEYGIIDILGSFAVLIGGLVKNIVQSQAFKDVVIGFTAKIKEMVKPEVLEGLNAISGSIKNSKFIENSVLASSFEADDASGITTLQNKDVNANDRTEDVCEEQDNY